ncbi:hypothetical protein KWH77_23685, partial [Enterobacter sichuanensis]|nr:hypothetical protein [Enterobacter sichuanensis]
FNIEEKLRGSFEEQAAVASAAVGAPYMTRNEIRRANNLPAIPGGDELVVPLNLSEGPQESTEETSTEAATDPDVTDEIEPPEAVKAVLTRHSARARRVIASKGSSPALT